VSITAEASVVLPTIGRPALIRECLESLARCDPRADEIVVVDSSDGDEVAAVVSEFESAGARVVPCPEKGLGNAFNLGLGEAKHEVVLLTNDDCTVDPSWVGAGMRHISVKPDAIVTGRVLPDGESQVVPSTIDDPEPHEYRGRGAFVLYTQCIALRRSAVLGFGGFDGRIQPSAEDNDLSYRWLRAGRVIRYEPDFVAWHHDWRTTEQLRRLYVDYGIGQGMVYGKYLRRGDLVIAGLVFGAVASAARAIVARIIFRDRQRPDPRLGFIRGLPRGLIRGMRIDSDST
jgi:GT2 family glycosyltransferase